MSRYHEVYAAWKKDPETFWAEAAREIDWTNLWDKVFDPYAGEYGRWFVGAECNTAYNCLDRHLANSGDKTAIIFEADDGSVTHVQKVSDTQGGFNGIVFDLTHNGWGGAVKDVVPAKETADA